MPFGRKIVRFDGLWRSLSMHHMRMQSNMPICNCCAMCLEPDPRSASDFLCILVPHIFVLPSLTGWPWVTRLQEYAGLGPLQVAHLTRLGFLQSALKAAEAASAMVRMNDCSWQEVIACYRLVSHLGRRCPPIRTHIRTNAQASLLLSTAGHSEPSGWTCIAQIAGSL